MSYDVFDGDTATFVVPVPLEAHHAGGPAWFEATVSGQDKGIQLVARDLGGVEVGRAEGRLRGDLEIEATITGPQGEVRITLAPASPPTAGGGKVDLRGTINGQAFTIAASGEESDASAAAGRVELAPTESQLMKDWATVGHPLTVIAQAMQIRETGSCAGCITSGVGEAVLAAACVDGALPACGALLITWPTFVDHCTGACA